MDMEEIVLVGELTAKYTYPELIRILRENKNKVSVVSFKEQKDAKQYLLDTLEGGETILFKASQSVFLEGLIEPLLAHKNDIARLPRQEKFWDEQRKKIGI
jgi:UDP-N-acetylmuramyl pentapeptide synthase